MDEKSLRTLEYPKILDRLSGYTSFSASANLVRALRPTNDHALAAERQERTTEARRLLSEHPDVSIGGARDVRPQVELAGRGGVLTPQDLLDIKATLVSARDLARFLGKLAGRFPRLDTITPELEPPAGLIEAISKVFSERGDMLDGASEKLAVLRSEVKAANERLVNKLESLINDPATARMLQEPIVTLRNGRYVVPLRVEFKGRMRCVVQDQSASGATLFVEPLAVVDLNNRWTEAILAEKEEVQRILEALSALVGEHTSAVQTLVRALALLDFSLACARYADDLRASEPLLLTHGGQGQAEPEVILRLFQARHPLLDPQTVVPIDIALEKGTRALVITGPNTGGKTVTLKTAGLLTLMALSGLHIPARSGSEVRVFRDVYADIGDEQSIEQSLSTFSGHVTNIVRILKRVNRATLVLLDELGAGTDPQEGSALARAILSYLLRRGAPCLIATHYPELKVFAHSQEGVLNASVEFDLKTLKPTYRLLTGIPGRSNALEIAARLGLDDEIIQSARQMVNPDDLRADDLLDEINRQLETARQERADAEIARQEAENLRQELSDRLEGIDAERLKVLETVREQARQELEELQQRIREMRRDTQQPGEEPARKKQFLREEAEDLEEQLSVPLEPAVQKTQPPRPLRKGDRVRLRSLNTEGVLMETGDEEVVVMVGKMRVRADIRNIERSAVGSVSAPERSEQFGATALPAMRPSPGLELHLRGLRAEEACLRLEKYLEDAYTAGMLFVRIVHGKGSGALRHAVRQTLSESNLVKRWENALDNEGGEGVTVAHIESD
jgi:DNA mismatch repair protein MutS2